MQRPRILELSQLVPPVLFSEIEDAARRALALLDPTLTAHLSIIAAPLSSSGTSSWIEVYPSDRPYAAELCRELSERFAAERQLLEGKTTFDMVETLKKVAEYDLRVGLRTWVPKHLEDYVFRSSVDVVVEGPRSIDEWVVFVALELPKDALRNCLSLFACDFRHEFLRFPLNLVRTTAAVILRECVDLLVRHKEIGRLDEESRERWDSIKAPPHLSDSTALIYSGGAELLKSAVAGSSRVTQARAFLSLFSSISTHRYEGQVALGRILLVDRSERHLIVTVRLTRPVWLHDFIAVRKLLEMTSDNCALLVEAGLVYGLGRVGERYEPVIETAMEIRFVGLGHWQLVSDGRVIMEVLHGQPRLLRAPLTQADFSDAYSRVFPETTTQQVQLHWDIVEAAVNAGHGSTIVVAEDASAEATRLALQSTPIFARRMSPSLFVNLSKIDGAILLAPEGICFGIGVILDGLATERGDARRGARYNSAMRYVETHGGRRLAVVVSADGHVDLLMRSTAISPTV